eukprot:TRINITY_DN654_c1_g1_i1.p1 TRINITY_DN654_c1_g1~~TRINITY_DN654_c1_g1_i1.p1  ORF type:complete len:321 (+),score=55.92 TRINITY_DN654_c1_g1_i1:85-1047(+)
MPSRIHNLLRSSSSKSRSCSIDQMPSVDVYDTVLTEDDPWADCEMTGYFAFLPNEIILHIFEYLPLNIWGKGSKVCRCWNRICSRLLEKACFTTENPNGKVLKMVPTKDLVALGRPPRESCNQREFRITVIGSGASGKSCLVFRFVQSHYYERYDPTIEDSYRKQIDIDGISCSLDIIDTGGVEYQALTDCYIRTGEGFMILYSINSRNSFEAVTKIRKRVLEIKSATCKKNPPPILLVATKTDLINDRVISTEEGQNLANSWSTEYNHNFFETSAKTNQHGVNQAFFELVRQIDQWRAKQPLKQEKPLSKLRKLLRMIR